MTSERVYRVGMNEPLFLSPSGLEEIDGETMILERYSIEVLGYGVLDVKFEAKKGQLVEKEMDRSYSMMIYDPDAISPAKLTVCVNANENVGWDILDDTQIRVRMVDKGGVVVRTYVGIPKDENNRNKEIVIWKSESPPDETSSVGELHFKHDDPNWVSRIEITAGEFRNHNLLL